jgi:hypothetical protein
MHNIGKFSRIKPYVANSEKKYLMSLVRERERERERRGERGVFHLTTLSTAKIT